MAIPGILKWLSDALYLNKYTGRWIDRWTIFRVWLALWLCATSMLITPVERAGGQAAFLPIIFGFLKYPSDPTIIFVFQTFLGGIVLCATWGWCVLAMKLSLLSRDHGHDQALVQSLKITIMDQNPHPSPAEIEGRLSEAVFTGVFLQAVPSLIYGIFLFIGIYFAFLIRAYNVRLFFIMVFSVILMAIYTTYGPLIPQFFAIELGQIFFIPYGYYLACTLFCSCFVMPQSVSHSVMEKLRTQGVLIKKALELSPARLRAMSDAEITSAVADWDQTRIGIIQQSDLVSQIAPFLAKEISVQRSSGKDVERLKGYVTLMSYTLAAQSVFIRHVRKKSAAVSKSLDDEGEATIGSGSDGSVPNLPYASLSGLRELLASLASATEAQTEAMIQGVTVLTNFLDRETNMSHATFGLWKQPLAAVEELELALNALRTATAGMENQSWVAKDNGATKGDYASHPSFLRDLWTAFLLVFSAELEGALDLAVRIEKRPVRRWWPGKQNEADHADRSRLPSLLSRMQKLHLAVGGQGGLPLEEDDPDTIDGLARIDELDEENGTPPKQLMLGHVYHAFQWFTSSVESTFALKVGVLAIALAVPAWIKVNGTAHFYYQYKGIWALVSGATAKGLFSGDTTFGFIQRLLGVFVGGLVAMAMWYISAGSGTGNPYALSAVFGVAFVFLVPWRIWNVNFLMIVTATTSATLIVGYSWADRPSSPVPTLWNPAQGWHVWWKRELVVLIGITAAWIIDLLPKPKPGREFLRRTYSQTTAQLGKIAADVLKSLRVPASDAMYIHSSEELCAISLKLRVTSARLMLAKLEPSLKSRWSPQRYAAIQRMQYDAVDLLALLSFVSQRMDPKTRTKLMSTPILQTAQISALLNLFHVASSGLATERPLPAVLPSPLVPTQYPDLDAELAAIVKEAGQSESGEHERLFVLAQGTCIQLAIVAEQIVAEIQGLFGKSMHWT